MTLAERLLQKSSSPSTEKAVAFVAIHAVRHEDGSFLQPLKERSRKTSELRRNHPPRSAGSHRFFYFEDYEDLASQLAEASWISPEQCDAVHRAAMEDRRGRSFKFSKTWKEHAGRTDGKDGYQFGDIIRGLLSSSKS